MFKNLRVEKIEIFLRRDYSTLTNPNIPTKPNLALTTKLYCLVKFGILYHIEILEKYFLHFDLELFSTLCPKADFGNMSVHPILSVPLLR